MPMKRELYPDDWDDIAARILMPMDRELYPDDWDDIAARIKESEGWECEACHKKCRRPGEKFDTHRRTLTVAHLNHKPGDSNPANLRALCAPCHCRYDARTGRRIIAVNWREVASDEGQGGTAWTVFLEPGSEEGPKEADDETQ